MKWLFLLFPLSLFALPKGAAPVSGQVQVESLSSSKMAVHASDRSVIHWDQFSINAGEKVKFVQPHSGAASFNHVVGGQASQILGMLKANGHVYLINPNGILIGKSGVINAAGFTASTLDLLDHSQGELRFKGSSQAQVINYGRVEALEGDVVLMGSSVINEGELIASKGRVALGAGSEIILRQESQERLFVVPRRVAEKEACGVDNRGSIEAAEAELKADGNVYKMAIKHTGVIEARELHEENGRILLVAERGVVESGGEMVARGGKVHMLGEKVGLTGEGVIDVSHESGGGEVLLGGDYQGGPGLRSKLTFIEEEARIDARATESGDGGKVIAWSDGGTVFYGTVNAEGGPLGGDGGFVEVSGLEHLNFSGRVSTLAPQGKTGTLLLDPTNVTISAAADLNATFAGGTYTYNSSTANIRATDLVANLVSSDVIVSTSSGFGSAGGITVTDSVNWTSSNNLTVISDDSMLVKGGANFLATGSGDLTVNCGGTLFLLENSGFFADGLGANITVTTGGSCILDPAQMLVRQGILSLNIGEDLSIRSSVDPAFIEAVTGFIQIDVGGNLTLTPSASHPAFIGTPIAATFTNADIFISSIGGNLSMVAGERFVQIGHSAIGNVGNVIIGEIGGDVILQAGSSAGAYSQIGHSPNGANFTCIGDVSVGPVHGKILIQGGTGDFSQALIGHGSLLSTEDGEMAGSISVIQEVIPATGNDLLIQSGAAEGASAGIGFIPTRGAILVASDLVSVDTNGPITLRTVDGEAQTSIGIFELTLGTGTALINEINVTTSRDLILQAGNGPGSTWGAAAIGSLLPDPNVAESRINIVARDMHWLTAATGSPYVINHGPSTTIGANDISIKTRNAFVGVDGPSSESAFISTARNLLLIADQDVHLGPSAVVVAAGGVANPPPNVGEITFVVDNAFPVAPELGPGRYISNFADIQLGGVLRIFSSRRVQNVINGPLITGPTPVVFAPGPIFLDTSTEHWKSYFPDSFGGFPYTIFYKDALPRFVNLYGRAISDMFKNLTTYDEFLFAPKCFLLGFDSLCYDESLHLHGEVSSFDLFQDKTYQLLRPRYRNYQTKYVESF